MSFVGALSFYTSVLKNSILTSNHFTIFYKKNSPCNWTKEDERLFQQLKTLTSETELTFANTKHPFSLQ